MDSGGKNTGQGSGQFTRVAHTAKAAWRRDPGQIILLMMLALASVILLKPSVRGNDGVQNYAYLRSLLLDRDLDFTNDYQHYMEQSPAWFRNEKLATDPVTGKPINLYGVGSAVLWAPWVAVAHGMTSWRNPAQADGYSRPYELAVGLSSCLSASVGLLLLHAYLRRRFGRTAAWWATVAVWLGTPLTFYMYFHPSMSHAHTLLLSSLLLYLTDRHWSWRGWLLCGAAAGLLTITRFQDVVLASVLVLARCWRQPSATWSQRVGGLAIAALAAVPFGFLQLAAWHELQGTWFSGPRAYRAQGSFNATMPHLLQAWFSPFHGLFHWHPALLLGLAGLLFAPRNLGPRATGLAAFLAASAVVGSWSIWWAGASFGQRMFISALPVLGLGGAALSTVRLRGFRPALLATVVLAIAWNFGLMVQYAAKIIPREQPVALPTLLKNNLFEVPRLLLHGVPRESVT